MARDTEMNTSRKRFIDGALVSPEEHTIRLLGFRILSCSQWNEPQLGILSRVEDSDPLGISLHLKQACMGPLALLQILACLSLIPIRLIDVPTEVDCILACAVKFSTCSLAASSLSIKREKSLERHMDCSRRR